MNKNIYMAIDYLHDNGKMRAMAIEIPRNTNFKRAIDEDFYLKNAFYIMIRDGRKEINEIAEQWNNDHEKKNRLMSWDELTEVIK